MKKKKSAAHPEMILFGQRLRNLREEKGWTQAEFGAQLGGLETPIQPSTISSWEQADKRPTVDTIIQMADLFGVTVDFLLGREKSSKIMVSELDALERLEGLIRIMMEENGRSGTLILNEDFFRYLIDDGRIETALRRTGLADDNYEMLKKSVKEKHKDFLASSNMNERPIRQYSCNMTMQLENYGEWLRVMKYSR